MAFKDRIKEARKKAGFSQKELAQQLDVSPQLVSFWELGKNAPNERAIYGLMHILGVDANYLYQDEMAETQKDRISDEELGVIFKIRKLNKQKKRIVTNLIDGLLDLQDEEEFPNYPYIQKPYFYSRPSAGGGNMIFDEEGSIRIRETKEAKKADFVLQVDGKSMEPKYADGDFVLVKSQDDVEIGEIGIFLVNGSAFIKQKKSDRLHSLNPSFSDIYPTESDMVRCYGKVIGKGEL